MDGPRRLKVLLDDVERRTTFPGSPLVVALSGGADSAALALLATRQGTARAIHVDHRLPGSPALAEAARLIAGRVGIEVETASVEVVPGASPEGQARRVRYEALAALSRPVETVLTGHTLDDSVETIVFNLIRGTGSRGLAGIPLRRPPNIFRPLLAVTRSETREIAALADLPFVDDPMNQDPTIARNVVRSRVLPLLTEMNPRFVENVARMGDRFGKESDLLERLAETVPVEWTEGGVSLPVGAILALDRAISDRVLLAALSAVVGGGAASAASVTGLAGVVRGEAAALELTGGVVARVEEAKLVIGPSGPTAPPRSLVPGTNRVGRLEFDVLASDRVCQVAPLSAWAALFPRDVALTATQEGVVVVDGEEAWIPGKARHPVAWYEPGTVGYLSVFARERAGWTSSL